jgi:hypothetical protein
MTELKFNFSGLFPDHVSNSQHWEPSTLAKSCFTDFRNQGSSADCSVLRASFLFSHWHWKDYYYAESNHDRKCPAGNQPSARYRTLPVMSSFSRLARARCQPVRLPLDTPLQVHDLNRHLYFSCHFPVAVDIGSDIYNVLWCEDNDKNVMAKLCTFTTCGW